jgi:hypothetical protein
VQREERDLRIATGQLRNRQGSFRIRYRRSQIAHQRVAVNEVEVDRDHEEAGDGPDQQLQADEQREPLVQAS